MARSDSRCLDREFYTRKVFGFLTRLQVPFIVPVRKHGKRMKELLQGTKNPVIRYLYAIISFLLRNVWIALLWKHFFPVRQGPKIIDMRAFRFDWFIVIIWEAIRASMGMVKGIPLFRQPI